MDKVILVDGKDNILGEVTRDEAHRKGLWHRVSVIYLYNDKGEVLIQQREDDGRLDHSSAGHVDPGESYLEAAKRELEEELGVKNATLVEIGKDQSDHKWNNQVRKHKYAIYMTKSNPVKIDKTEVKNVFWINPHNILDEISKDNGDLKYTAGIKVTLKHLLKHL